MPSATRISLAARERLRDHHTAAAKTVAFHAAALGRLDAATSRRAEVLSRHDVLVADAASEVNRAVAEVARVMGVDAAAAVLGVSKAEVRRVVRATTH
jgi:hypothetical protein